MNVQLKGGGRTQMSHSEPNTEILTDFTAE